jgi:transcription initiation factor TFIID TATA-box-binding protein
MKDIIKQDQKAESLDIDIANMVGSGDLEMEIDLAAVAEDIPTPAERIESVEHSRRRGNRLNIRFTDWDTLGILAPTGVTTITGAKSYEELYQSNDDMISSLVDIGLIERPVEDGFGVRNLVFVGDLERDINLDALAIGIGLEHVEYEPEQFPGLVYRPQTIDCTVLVFATGKAIVTGVVEMDTAIEAHQHVRDQLNTFL